MNLREFCSWLDAHLNFEKFPQKNMFWLDTMYTLCAALGNPEKACECFHIAGSKGKGSTANMVYSILTERGCRAGLYTSPHIISFTERIGSFGDEVYSKSADTLVAAVEHLEKTELKNRPVTWFELVTAFAMLCYKNAKCTHAVYEVGLGGRLDATNVINPICCGIGPIEKEHTEYLGDTLEKIAYEKGGIIKENIPVISAPQEPSVKKVLKNIAEEKHSKILFIDDVCKVTSIIKPHSLMKISIGSPLFSRKIETSLKMQGAFQAWNAALASVIVKTAYNDIDEGTIERGLSKAYLEARFEIIDCPKTYKDIPCIVLDGAHTVNSAKNTVETFKSYVGGEGCLLFASASDKDVEHIALIFKEQFAFATLTKPGYEKHCDIARLKNAFYNAKIEYTIIEDCKEALHFALKRANENKMPLLITGSFYLIAEIKKLLSELEN